jgi:hypothetical protein
LDENAVNHRHASPYDSRQSERRVLPGHFHNLFHPVGIQWRLLRRLSADPFHEIAAGVGEFEFQPLDQFGDRRRVQSVFRSEQLLCILTHMRFYA